MNRLFSLLPPGVRLQPGPCAALVLFAVVLGVRAYPPAPHHLIYGLVRDAFGEPIVVNSALVLLETTAGITTKTEVVPGLEPGVNYKLRLPMDSGVTADKYKPTALRPTVPFKIRVIIDGATYLPIEMAGDYAQLGLPSAETHLDLTLGEDANANGLPDAWERAMLSHAGLSQSELDPDQDLDGDGLSNFQEYIAGTYAFDPQDGFILKIIEYNGETPVLEFLAIRGRTYTLLGSQNMVHWSPVAFRIAGASDLYRTEYYASDARTVRIEGQPTEPAAAPFKFFKLMVR